MARSSKNRHKRVSPSRVREGRMALENPFTRTSMRKKYAGYGNRGARKARAHGRHKGVLFRSPY